MCTFKALETEIHSHDKIVSDLKALSQKLLDESHPDSKNIRKRQVQQTYNTLLTTIYYYH